MIRFTFMHLIVHRHAKLRVHMMRHKLKSKGISRELEVLGRDLRRLNMKMRELSAALNE